ncbi:MAG: AAA family ATPase [Candidatus Delongbacteria bacterium]|nr:AAA family ATPase [Candidatus Delongbacteria bacterium]
MIKRIRINNYKSFNDFELELNSLSVIFGPNASGKSNFLDALQLLSRMATTKPLKNAFDSPYRGRPLESFTFPDKGIEGLLKRDSVDFSFSVDIELSDFIVNEVNNEIVNMRKGLSPLDNNKGFIKENSLRYDLEVEFIPQKGFLRIKNEKICALKQDLNVKNSRTPFLEKKDNRLSLRMEGQAHPTFYEIGLDYTILSLPLYPPHYPHLTALKREMENWMFYYFEPRERMRAANPTREVIHIGMMGEDLAAFLHTLKNNKPEKFKAIERAMHSIIPTIDHIETIIDNKTGEVELSLIENNVKIPSRLLSEGTLRLLGLLSISGGQTKPSLICFEEPENGIHPRRIELIAEYLKTIADKNSQIIVTTHSPVLPDMVDNDSLYICSKKNGNTAIHRFNETGLFRHDGIGNALNNECSSLSEMIMRGDLDV